MTYNARFYNVTTSEQNAATSQHDGAFEKVEDAVAFATEHGLDIELSDAAGFTRGYVHANGNYSLT